MPVNRQILFPPRLWFICTSLIVALLLNLMPAMGKTSMHWMPDWLLLTTLYWALYQPRKIGFTVAFLAGLLMDVANGQWLGQHALAYVTVLLLLLLWHRRLLMHSPLQQTLYVGGLLVISSALIACIGLISGGLFPGLSWFVSPILGMLLWPTLTYILQIPQRRAPISHL